MRSSPRPADDPVLRRLVTLLEEQLPNSAHQARIHLLAQLSLLEQDAVATGVDPGTLRSIRAVQLFVRTSDPLTGA